MRGGRSGGRTARRRHEVTYIAEAGSGVSDKEVLRRARAEARLLLTEDKGFGELVFRSHMAVPGIVLLRIDAENNDLKWRRLDAAIATYREGLFGRYLVIEAARFRSRPLLRMLPNG